MRENGRERILLISILTSVSYGRTNYTTMMVCVCVSGVRGNPLAPSRRSQNESDSDDAENLSGQFLFNRHHPSLPLPIPSPPAAPICHDLDVSFRFGSVTQSHRLFSSKSKYLLPEHARGVG